MCTESHRRETDEIERPVSAQQFRTPPPHRRDAHHQRQQHARRADDPHGLMQAEVSPRVAALARQHDARHHRQHRTERPDDQRQKRGVAILGLPLRPQADHLQQAQQPQRTDRQVQQDRMEPPDEKHGIRRIRLRRLIHGREKQQAQNEGHDQYHGQSPREGQRLRFIGITRWGGHGLRKSRKVGV